MDVTIRPATGLDAAAVWVIYAPIVRNTAVSFETQPPSMDELEKRIARSIAWLMYEDAAGIAGYAYAAPFHPRAAYRWSAEISVYLAQDRRGAGIGRRLVSALMDDLASRGYVNAFAGSTLPNEASTRLFESLGFRQVALWEHVGFKLGAWHDVGWWQCDLRDPPVPPAEPR